MPCVSFSIVERALRVNAGDAKVLVITVRGSSLSSFFPIFFSSPDKLSRAANYKPEHASPLESQSNSIKVTCGNQRYQSGSA